MIKRLIIGLDLSFSSTGLTIGYLEDWDYKHIQFHRIVYNKTPKNIENITQHTYILPTNITFKDLVKSDETEYYAVDQSIITLKCMIISKKISNIIASSIIKYNIDELYVNIEGNVIGGAAGSNQLRVIAGLIMLNMEVRSSIIKMKLDDKYNLEKLNLYITSPTTLKKFFTGSGKADKGEMLRSFIDIYDGNKLLPDTSSLHQINDVIDSFALMANMWFRLHSNNYTNTYGGNKKRIKSAKRKNNKSIRNNSGDIIRESTPTGISNYNRGDSTNSETINGILF